MATTTEAFVLCSSVIVVHNQAIGMKLRGEPTSFGCCIREVRIAGTRHDERRHPTCGYNGYGKHACDPRRFNIAFEWRLIEACLM
jgi:hypothetical protein